MTYASFHLASSVLTRFNAWLNPPPPAPLTEDQIRERELSDKLCTFFSQQRLLTINTHPPLECMIVLRQTKSWHFVVNQLDQVKETATNKAWKNKVKKISGLALVLDYALKNNPGSAQLFLDDLRFEKKLSKIVCNPPADCQHIASYIVANNEALSAFRTIDEAAADRDCIFFDIVDPTQIQLSQTICGVFGIQETTYTMTTNPHYPNYSFAQSTGIDCISNQSFSNVSSDVYTTNFNIVQRAIKSANAHLKPA